LSSPEPPEAPDPTSNADESLVGEAEAQAAAHQSETDQAETGQATGPGDGGEVVEGLPVTGGESDGADAAPMPPGDLTGEPTADEEVVGEQVEATAQAAEAEGHAEGTAAGSGDVDTAQEEPEGAPVAEAMAAATEGVEPEPGAEPEAEPQPEAEAEPVDPTTPDSTDDMRLGLLDEFKAELGDSVVGAHIRDGADLWVRVTPEAWREVAQIAKGKLGCRLFVFLNAIDWMPSPYGRSEGSPFDAPAEVSEEIETGYAGGETRFQVFGRVHNHERGYGVILKVDVAEPEVGVPTWVPVYPGANWHERETWEMFGISFSGHPHLKHLYLPTGFEGHPLRKDFPLLARQVKPWPGIVDVEPMPDEDDAEADADAAGEGAAP